MCMTLRYSGLPVLGLLVCGQYTSTVSSSAKSYLAASPHLERLILKDFGIHCICGPVFVPGTHTVMQERLETLQSMSLHHGLTVLDKHLLYFTAHCMFFHGSRQLTKPA